MNDSARPVEATAPSGIDADAGPPEADAITRIFVRHWLLIGIAAIIGAVAGLLVSRALPRIYRAEILVTQVQPSVGSPLKGLAGGQVGALAGLAGLDLRANNNTAAFVAMLKSRIFLQRFIAEKNLLPVLFAKRWDAQQGRWRSEAGAPPPTVQDGYGTFEKRVMHVLEDKEKGLLTISVEWTDPALAAEWANALVARLNEAARQQAILNAERSISYLNKELETTQPVEIRQSIYSLLQGQINDRMLANTRPDFAFSVIDPAEPPQPKDFVRPIPLLMAAIGFLVGVLLAMLATLIPGYFSRRAAAAVRPTKR